LTSACEKASPMLFVQVYEVAMKKNSQIAILGWGSLLCDPRPSFDKWHDPWKYDGPQLRLEFCKKSVKTRKGALTLAIDETYGAPCTVAYAITRRKSLGAAVTDLRKREGMKGEQLIGRIDVAKTIAGESEPSTTIRAWARGHQLDFVVWTALTRDLEPFSVQHAVNYIQGLSGEGKSLAAEYIWRAPPFIQTPVRSALQVPPWF
jgi:hypothetical protein